MSSSLSNFMDEVGDSVLGVTEPEIYVEEEAPYEEPEAEVEELDLPIGSYEEEGDIPQTAKELLDKWHHRIVDIDALIDDCLSVNASDLYVRVGAQPSFTIYGTNYRMDSYPISGAEWDVWSKKNILNEQNVLYSQNKRLDISYETSTALGYRGTRTRCTMGWSMGRSSAVFRLIKAELPSFKNIDYPEDIQEAIRDSFSQHGGLTVLSGVTGSGKTTTTGSSFNDFSEPGGPLHNKTLLTLEDPVEFLYTFEHKMNVIQKELHKDFLTFPDGTQQAVREHPDFILVGETRDAASLTATIEACRTGHSSITTFHAGDVKGVVSRMINYLQGANQYMVTDLINQLNLIVVQQVVKSDVKFVLKTQWMRFTPEAKNIILDSIEQGSKSMNIIDELLEEFGRDWA